MSNWAAQLCYCSHSSSTLIPASRHRRWQQSVLTFRELLPSSDFQWYRCVSDAAVSWYAEDKQLHLQDDSELAASVFTVWAGFFFPTLDKFNFCSVNVFDPRTETNVQTIVHFREVVKRRLLCNLQWKTISPFVFMTCVTHTDFLMKLTLYFFFYCQPKKKKHEHERILLTHFPISPVCFCSLNIVKRKNNKLTEGLLLTQEPVQGQGNTVWVFPPQAPGTKWMYKGCIWPEIRSIVAGNSLRWFWLGVCFRCGEGLVEEMKNPFGFFPTSRFATAVGLLGDLAQLFTPDVLSYTILTILFCLDFVFVDVWFTPFQLIGRLWIVI